jgi:hypothetical protein
MQKVIVLTQINPFVIYLLLQFSELVFYSNGISIYIFFSRSTLMKILFLHKTHVMINLDLLLEISEPKLYSTLLVERTSLGSLHNTLEYILFPRVLLCTF